MAYGQFNSKVYQVLHDFSLTQFAIILLGLWAFFEASFWFIIPDLILVVLVIMNPKAYKKFFLVTFTLSIIGIILYYFFVYMQPKVALNILINTPFTKEVMIDKIMSDYASGGFASVLKQAFSGIPSKVWTYSAVKTGFNIVPYTIIVAVSRGFRMFIIAFTISKISLKYTKFIKNNLSTLLIAYIIIFFAILFSIS